MSTASIAMSFWIKIIRIAYYAINWSPSTTTEFKTFIEMCTSKLVNYSFLYIFDCPTYVMFNTQERTKFNAKSIKYIFINYANGVKGYES